MNVDVIMLTKNSGKPYFKKCLSSIQENVPVNKLIVVDAYSTDNTIEVIKEFFPRAMIIQTTKSLAQARKLAIANVETEWFAFIDSDILLFPKWFNLLSQLRNEVVGCVQGTDQYANQSLIRYSEWKKNSWGKEILNASANQLSVIDLDSFKRGQFRGLTHNSLLRTSCVKDWDPPLNLNVGEDHHLFLHVIKQGYKWVVVNDPVCWHYAFLDLAENIHRGFREAQEVKKICNYGYIQQNDMWIDSAVKIYLKMFVLSFVKGLFASLCKNDPKILMYKSTFYGAMLLSHLLNCPDS